MYGGGRLGLTGTEDEDGDLVEGADHGFVTINISGGSVGSAADEPTIGNVFGGGKGLVEDVTGLIPSYKNLAKVKGTQVNIYGTARVYGNVYGGGELGKVFENANVRVYGDSEIGSALTNASGTSYNGSVFGGGKGYDGTQSVSDPGEVLGNAYVRIEDGQVKENVYGGGELASVGTLNAQGTAYVNNSGLADVNISGGQIGVEQIGQDQATISGGFVFGGGLGKAGDGYADYANVGRTNVQITDDGYVTNSVFGGGDNGHVKGNTVVTIDGSSVIGQRNTYEEFLTDQNEQPSSDHIYTGSVLGGGRGVEKDGDNYSHITGLVYGNTNVTVKGNAVVRHAVYGGGGLSSVGTFTYNNAGEITGFTQNTGKTEVHIEGNALIGPTRSDLVREDYTDAQIKTALLNLGGNTGWVFGSGCGLAGEETKNLTFNYNTEVTIKDNAQVTGSVFGGGENGHVYQDTDVNIEGGTIGAFPLLGAGEYTFPEGNVYYDENDDEFSITLTDAESEVKEDNYGAGLRRVFRGEVYGGGKGTDIVNGAYSRTAGRVYGNTNVTVTGGTIYNKVYGGGSLASVGQFVCYEDPETHVVDNDSIIGVVAGTGLATVTIDGVTIGSVNGLDSDGHNSGDVYGGGRGLPGKARKGTTPADQVVNLAYVGSTDVTIS